MTGPLGFDHAGRPTDYPAFASAARSAGYVFEFRYLCFTDDPAFDAFRRDLNRSKLAQPDEVWASRLAGLEVVLIWQNTKKDVAGGEAAGRRHGAEAARLATEIGYPHGLTIYFAIGDYDAPVSDHPLISQYLYGVHAEIAERWEVGGYGKRSVLEAMLDTDLIDRAFQSYGYSRPQYEISPEASVYQRQGGGTVGGIPVDVDEAFADVGGWKPVELWHPRALRVTPNPYTDGGSFLDGYGWRQGLHTTEGGPDYRPSHDSYYGHAYWPHATGARVGGVAQIVQHLPINKAARAAANLSGGVETNRARMVQMEIGWWADRIHDLPEDIAAVVRDWVTWVARQIGAPLSGPRFYDNDETAALGWQITSLSARQRMSQADWKAFSGVCGHQHIPENSHWDPGQLDLNKLIAAQPAPAPAPTPASQEDEMNLIEVPWPVPGQYPFPKSAWKVSPGPVDGSSFTIVSFDGAPLDRVPVLRANGAQDGGPFVDKQKDAKGRTVDFVAYGLWCRNVYDTIGNYQGFVRVDADTVAVMTGIGTQYVIGRR